MAFHNTWAAYLNHTGKVDRCGRTLTDEERKAASPHHPLWRADAVYAMDAIAAALTPDYSGCLNDAWKLDEVRSMRGLAEAAEAALAVEEPTNEQRALVTDPLTGVLNRAAIMHLVDRAPASSLIVFLDLDRFKPVNDLFGHRVGDHVLSVVGHRLRLLAGEAERPWTVGRLGGDEFVVIIPAHQARADDLCRIEPEIARDISTGSSAEVRIGVSVGVALRGYGAVAEVLESADQEMYRSKARKSPDNRKRNRAA
jgi:diguanylate cyclase (GGDEF)-like protein